MKKLTRRWFLGAAAAAPVIPHVKAASIPEASPIASVVAGNSLLTPAAVARKALRVLHENMQTHLINGVLDKSIRRMEQLDD